jgi:hypothetical protein
MRPHGVSAGPGDRLNPRPLQVIIVSTADIRFVGEFCPTRWFMAVMDDVNALLSETAEQLGALRKLHDRALTDKNLRDRFKVQIKGILENLRSPLDYLAVAVTERYGTPSAGMIYYPLAQSASDFTAQLNSKMPGVSAHPLIADAFARHQPYLPTHGWLRELNQLTREQKHNRLSLQLVRESFTTKVTEKATGASMVWADLQFKPGMLVSDHGGRFMPRSNLNRDPAAPKLFEVGVGPTGFETFGIPIDLSTQLPYPADALEVEQGKIEEWFFTTPHLPVLIMLTLYHQGVSGLVADIAQAAAL